MCIRDSRNPYQLSEGGPEIYCSALYSVKGRKFEEGGPVPDLIVGMDSGWLGGLSVVMNHKAAAALDLGDVGKNILPVMHLVCPDRKVPANLDDFRIVANQLLDFVYSGKKLEIGCVGGHGRTGTLAGYLTILHLSLIHISEPTRPY